MDDDSCVVSSVAAELLPRGGQRAGSDRGSGSAVVLHGPMGFLLTNAHVVGSLEGGHGGASSTGSGESWGEFLVVGRDRSSDLG